MCFTAREQAVRRRRPASYSSHIVDIGQLAVETCIFFSAATERCPRLTADRHQCLRGRLPRGEGTAADTCSADHGWLCCSDARANPRRRCCSRWLFERRPHRGRPHGAVQPGTLDVIQVLRHPVVAVIIIVG